MKPLDKLLCLSESHPNIGICLYFLISYTRFNVSPPSDFQIGRKNVVCICYLDRTECSSIIKTISLILYSAYFQNCKQHTCTLYGENAELSNVKRDGT
jgi:hypothetical protein